MSVSRVKNAGNGRVKSRRGVAFYDLEGTLVDLNLVHAVLFILANLGELHGRIGYLLSFAARAPRLYMAERNDRSLLNKILFEAFRGVSVDRLYEMGEEYCDRVLIKHLYPRAVAMLEANRQVDLEPVLITGAPDFVVAPLARHLGITEFGANRLLISAGRATGKIAAPILASGAKANWCSDYAAERNLDLRACWGYADSYYDLPFLAALGHPVAVNPDRKLRAMAMTRHWPIITFEKSSDDEPDAVFGDDIPELSGRPSDGAS
ncbi:MAG: HAD family hydrolase [Candidatus Binataceae bacterium]